MGNALWIHVERGFCNGFHEVEPSQYGADPLKQARRNAVCFAEILGGRVSIVRRGPTTIETVEVIREG